MHFITARKGVMFDVTTLKICNIYLIDYVV